MTAEQQLPTLEQERARRGRSSGRCRRPTGRVRSSPTRASPRTCPSSTAPTSTSTSAGTWATSATCRASPGGCPGWCGSCPSSAPRPCPSGDAAAFARPERWPDLDWDELELRYALQKPVFDRHVPPDGYATFAGWRDATQRYQAEVIRRMIEELRRLKYRPTGGFAQFLFADGQPGVTWSVLDHERRPKLGLRGAAGRVPAGDRRGRPPAGDGARPATRWRSTSTSCPTCGRRSTTPG